MFLVFILLVYFPKKMCVSLFIIIRHELPLMKLSSVLFRKFLHLSLYFLSYEYVMPQFD